MTGDVQKLMRMIFMEEEKKKKLAVDIDTLKHEVNASRGLAVIEKERYHLKLVEVKAIEDKLKQTFIEDQQVYDEEEKQLDAEINEITEQLVGVP